MVMEKKSDNWTKFEVYPNFWAKALLKDNKVEQVKLITHAPRQFYYSFLNDAALEAEKLINP